MKPKILICNDNEFQRQNLIDFLNELNISIDIYESSDPNDIQNKASSQNIDIIISEVILKNINTIDIIKKIKSKHPYISVIFITAYQDYIMDAVSECHCYDYILKPVNKERFQNTMNSVLNKIQEEGLLNNKNNLVIQYNNQSFVIPIDDILFIEQYGYLSIIHTIKKSYKCVSTLVHLYNELNDNFFLTHKSFLVNINNISHIEYNGKSSSDIFFNNYHKPALLSVRKKSEFKKFIQNYQK